MSNQLPPFILIVQTGPQPGQTFVVQEGVNRIGRNPTNEIALADRSVSREHARIVRSAQGVWIEDLGSTTGTFVNGQQLTASVWLQPGDVVHIGPTVALGLQVSQPAAAPAAPVSAPRRGVGCSLIAIPASLLLIVLVVLAAVAWWFFWPTPAIATPSGPIVFIHEPEPNASAAFNRPLLFFASARDEKRVNRAELWVDGQLVAAGNSDLPEGLTPFTFAPRWVPLTTGARDFFVRAYNTDGLSGESSVVNLSVLQVRSEPDQLIHVTQQGDTLQNLAERSNSSVEEIITLNPVIVEVAEEQGVQPEDLEIPPNEEIVLPPTEGQPGGEAEPGSDGGTTEPLPPGPPPHVPDPPEPGSDDKPSPPLLEAAEADGCSVGLSWTPVEGSAGYRLYRREATSPGYADLSIVGSNQTSFVDTVPRNGTWMYIVAALDPFGQETRGKERALVITGCDLASAPASDVHLEVIDFQPSTGSSPDDIYCYIVHNRENSLVTVPLDATQPQAMSPGGTLGILSWQPSNPLTLYFSCFDRSVKPSQYLGYTKDKVEFDEEAWERGYIIRPAFTAGSSKQPDYFLLEYRLCLGPCPPLDEGAGSDAGSGDLPPPAPPSTDTDMPPPQDLDWARSSFDCARVAWNSIGFNVCRGFPFDGNYRVLTWDWFPAHDDQELWSFEVWQRIYREGEDPPLIGQATVVETPNSRVAGNTGALVPEIQDKLGCDQVAEVFVQAVGPNGRSEKSEPLPMGSGPPCDAKVTVTFDTLRASDVDDGWFGLNDDMETTGWVAVNERFSQLTKERDIDEDDTYDWSQLGLNRGPTFSQTLGPGEFLTIQAQLYDNDEGIWCNDSLVLPGRTADEWAEFDDRTQTLNHRETYDAAKCNIKVSISGEVIR
jgi:hypothetical protein